MTTDAVTSGIALESLIISLIFDGAVFVVLLIAQVFLYGGCVMVVSKKTAEHNWKIFVGISLVMIGVFTLLTPTDSLKSLIIGLSGMVVVGALLTWKKCWISFEKAFTACLCFGVASAAITFYSSKGLDLLLVPRQSISLTLAGLVDSHVRQSTKNPAFAASAGLVDALLRAAVSTPPSDDGVVGTLMSPLRTGMKAKQQIKDINKIATDQAMIVNMLAGAGTNVGNRSGELATLQSNLVAEAKGERPLYATNSPAAPDPLRAAGTNDLLPGLEPASPVFSSNALPGQAPAAGNPEPQPVARMFSPPADFKSEMVNTNQLAKLSPADRTRWESARSSIRVTGTGRSAKGIFVMIGRQMVCIDEVHRFSLSGTNYAFRLRHVNGQLNCIWEPVFDEAPTQAVDVVFF